MSAVLSGLVGAVVAIGLVSLAQRTQKAAVSTPDGWKALKAGWLINSTIIGSTALAALPAYSLLSGGSRLPDAEAQNGFAGLLAAIFAGCALYTAWTAYGRLITWKGNDLRVRAMSGGESLRRISDVTNIRKCEMRGEYRLTFRDGSTLCFSAYLHGSNELVAKMPQGAFRDQS